MLFFCRINAVFYVSNVAGIVQEAGIPYPLRAPRFIPGFPCYIFLVFSVVLCFCILYVFVLHLLWAILAVSLNCPFLIVSLVFCNCYLCVYSTKLGKDLFHQIDYLLNIMDPLQNISRTSMGTKMTTSYANYISLGIIMMPY